MHFGVSATPKSSIPTAIKSIFLPHWVEGRPGLVSGGYDGCVSDRFHLECDVCIVGGGTGGTAAALALAGTDVRVLWITGPGPIGGQLTSQAVPPDEHPWIETTGCTATYREFRNRVRAHYRLHGGMTPTAQADPFLNPGGGWVSRLCFSPVVGVEVLHAMLGAPAGISMQKNWVPLAADVAEDCIRSVRFRRPGLDDITVEAAFFLDATELGDLIRATGTEYRLGAESQAQTGEPNALPGEPEPGNVQSFTWCAALTYEEGADHTIEEPANYSFWRDHQPPHWPDKLLSFSMLNVQTGEPRHFPLFGNGGFNLFSYRQIANPEIHQEGVPAATIMNWPMNDYALGSVVDVDSSEAERHYESAKDLTRSMLYWLQNEHGYRGLRFAPEHTGTDDGLAAEPYIRESRRIEALHTVCEQDIAAYTNPGLSVAPEMPMSVGVGAYRIDLHPSASGHPTIDTSTLPFQIPLGSLIPVRVRNLIAAGKNLGVTHITNGCYRLHPIEWNIGEAAAHLAASCLQQGTEPAGIHGSEQRFSEFQNRLWRAGIQTDWPRLRPL